MNYKDFPSLHRDGRDYLHELKLHHFSDGLDVNSKVDAPDYVFSTFNHRMTTFSKTHILVYVLRQAYAKYNDEDKEKLLNFFKENVLSLVKENKLSSADLKQIAIEGLGFDEEIAKFFIDNKLLNIDQKFDNNQTLLMLDLDKKVFKLLVDNGCDLYAKLENYDKYSGLDIYEIALREKRTGLVKIIKEFLSEEYLEKKKNESIDALRKEKNVRKQLALFRVALTDNNSSLVDEIVNNQEKYKSLIEYDDSQNNTLINCAIRTGKKEILEKIINIDYYKKDKEKTTKETTCKEVYCYTYIALYSNKNQVANFLYDNGFRNVESLKENLIKRLPYSRDIVNKLSHDGCQFSIEDLFKHNAVEALKNTNYSIEEIEEFLSGHQYLLNMSNLLRFDGKSATLSYKKQYRGNLHTYYEEISKERITFISELLKKQKVYNIDAFENNLKVLAQTLGDNTEKVGLKFGAVLMSNFMDKDLINEFSYYGRKEWITKINKENLEKFLEENSEKEVPHKKTINKRSKI